jgi:preprotein translocase subunit YajC
MLTTLFNAMILAQTTMPAPTTQPKTPEGSGMQFMLMIVIFFGIFYFIALRPRQKEQKKREQLLKSIKKYDKVMTIGGIIGSVMEIRDDEVILKVDDNTNTRIKFSRSAVQRVLNSADADKENV